MNKKKYPKHLSLRYIEVVIFIAEAMAKSAVEVGHQEIDGKYSGVATAREQRQFIIDPDAVRSLPTFHWFVSLDQKVSHLYVPPMGYIA